MILICSLPLSLFPSLPLSFSLLPSLSLLLSLREASGCHSSKGVCCHGNMMSRCPLLGSGWCWCLQVWTLGLMCRNHSSTCRQELISSNHLFNTNELRLNRDAIMGVFALDRLERFFPSLRCFLLYVGFVWVYVNTAISLGSAPKQPDRHHLEGAAYVQSKMNPWAVVWRWSTFVLNQLHNWLMQNQRGLKCVWLINEKKS